MTNIRTQYAEFVKTENERVVAETTLRNAAVRRELATEAVVDSFQNPQDFYQQLVARRAALKAEKDAIVAKASEDGGTPSEAQTKAASDAQDALTMAEEEKAKVDAISPRHGEPRPGVG